MNKYFNPESPIFLFINKLCYCTWLNLLWFICCLPIFTIGASTTALYDITLKVVRNEEGNITKQFFNSFRNNFKQATTIWLGLSILGLILGLDAYVIYHLRNEHFLWTICFAFIIAAFFLYMIVLLYVFPLISHFENTTKKMLLNAFLLGIRYLFCSLLMMFVHFMMLYLIINIFTPLIVFGEGLCAFICTYFLNGIFKKLEEDPAI